jgi:hypothetical protein
LYGIHRYLFQSSITRYSYVWPKTLNYIISKGNIILGRGIGGIGAPASKFDPTISYGIFVDNLFIHLYGILGLMSIILLILYAKYINRDFNAKDKKSIFFYLIALSFLLRGITASSIASDFMAVFWGMSISYLFVSARKIKTGECY